MALLEPDVQRIAPAATEPAADRIPDWAAEGTPEPLRSDLEQLLGADRVLARASDLVGYASDASPYRLLPQAVVMAHDVDDVRKVLAYGKRHGVPVTLRAAGTSLNGQAQSDGILIDVRRHWVSASVEDDGARLRVQPGMVLGHANRVLAPHGRRLGPDPASTDAAAVGGVIANNSGGMRCGVTQDSYSTLRSMTLLLASGTLIDTAEPDAEARFAAAEPELAAGLEAIRDELRADSDLTARVRRKFEIKNTTGYRLIAFLDADTPLEIFRRVVVGSEGTLAFVAEAVFDTVPVPPMTTVSWVHFPDIDAATAPVGDLVTAGATAVELMVAPALMVASHSIPGAPEHWRELPAESAALLIEFGADDAAGLDRLVERAEQVLGAHELLRAPDFTRDREEVEVAWRVREGLFGLVGRLRPPGTALITEDVCVPPARMAESATDIQALLAEHGFLTGVAGHASAGNLHFMLSPSFADPADRERYESFISKLVDLIVDKYDGSLKAEHGTGRNMAPFVEREWGAKATEMMWRIKALADPDGVLNPGAVLNRDPDVHLRNLKTTPDVEEEVTLCVECGFCEPVCPSRWLTTTPRQRIVLRREMARQPPGSPVLGALLAEYEHDAIQTCAADGSCKLACPLGIDTGALMKDFRAQERTPRAQHNASRIAARWETVERAARAGLRAGAIAGGRPMRAGTAAARALFSDDLVPSWPANMPAPAPARLPVTSRESAVAVYLPACINRIFGTPRDAPTDRSLPEALVAVSARAGLGVWIPPDVAGHCCATPFASKGYADAAQQMADHTVAALWRWTEQGRLPVIVDATSCTHGLTDAAGARHPELEVLDAIVWVHDRVLPRLTPARRVGSVAVHPTCSGRHLGLTHRLEAVAAALAEEVVVPAAAGCCGFAGDRGMLHPDLPAAALRDEASELAGRDFDAHLCGNRTCELGLQEATGKPYVSFVSLLDELTQDPVPAAAR